MRKTNKCYNAIIIIYEFFWNEVFLLQEIYFPNNHFFMLSLIEDIKKIV